MLVHDKLRLAFSLCGISFAVLIMFMQIGFFNGLNDSQANLPPFIDADLVMMDEKKVHLNKWDKFSRTRLHQTLAFEEVKEVIPVYEGWASLKNETTGLRKPIAVLAFPIDTFAFSIPGMKEHQAELKEGKVVLFDERSRELYGDIRAGGTVNLSGVEYRVAGLVSLGANFSRDGFVFMSDSNWVRHHYQGRESRLTLGFIRARPGSDIAALKSKIQELEPRDFIVLTPEELRQREVNFVTHSTPIGAVFGVGLVAGFCIGVIICYQILFNEIVDHLPQYATLSAVGFSNRYLVGIILKEALLLSVLGFLPGLVAGVLLYTVLEAHTRIIMFLSAGRVAFVLVLTVFMCVLAAVLALRKVLEADPAELY